MIIVSLIILFFIPGLAGWSIFGNQLKERVSTLEAIFLIILGSIVTTSWIAITLAEFERFSLSAVVIILLIGSVSLSGWAMKNGRFFHPFKGTFFSPLSLLIFPILFLAIWLSPQPHEYINGGRDHGLYVNTGIHIARTGGIFIYDTELANAPSESKSLLINPAVTTERTLLPATWSEGRRLPGGMTIRDLEQGIVTPQSFHLYPVWIAIFAAMGGVNLALLTTTILGIFGVFAVYIAGARLFGQPVGLLTAFLLTLNLAQLWYTRTPSAEILLQTLFWGGLFAFVLMLTTNNRYAAVIAGLSFGLMHMTKLDTVFVFIVVVIFLLYRWFRSQFPSTYWYFVATYGLLSLHATLHAFFISTIYFLEQMTRVLLPKPIAQIVINAADEYYYPVDILRRLITQNGIIILLGLLALVVFLFFAQRFRQEIGNKLMFIEHNAYRGKTAVSLMLFLLIATIYLTPIVQMAIAGHSFPQFDQLLQWISGPPRSSQFVTFIKWYLTPVGVFLGIIGMVQIASDKHGESLNKRLPAASNFVWLLLTINILSLFMVGSEAVPDQFWAIRRFVPIVLPALILFVAYALWQLFPKQRQEWAKGLLPLGLIVILVLGLVQNFLPFLRFTDYGGMIEQTAVIAESFPDDAVILFDNTFGNGRVAAPLWQVFEKTVFMLEEGAISDPDLTAAIKQWQESGRDVFWLSSGDDSPSLPGNLAANYEGQRTWALLWAERPFHYLPTRSGLFLNSVDVHHLIAADIGAYKSVSTIPFTWQLGNPVGDVVPVEGLYGVHQLPGLTPRRWTSGRVMIEIPVSDALSELAIMMGNGRSSQVSPADVSITIDGTHLATVQVTGTNDIYTVTLPPELQFSNETAELILEMDPWIPAQTGSSADQRELGVYLDWVKLITTQGAR